MTGFSTIPSDQIYCSYFPQCSGCEIHDAVTSLPVWEDVKSFFQSNVTLHHRELIGWRTRSKLAVRGLFDDPQIGLFKRGTHDVVSIPDCPLHHPAIFKAYQAVREGIVSSKLSPYQENPPSGIIRYLQFVVERKSRRIQLAITINRQGKDPLIDRFVKQLYKEGMFLSIWVNYQPESTNRIFGEKWELIAGEPYLLENLNGLTFYLHPACFAQAHLSLFEQILKSIQSLIFPKKHVVELYAGIGVIGFNVAHLSKQVICSEINPHSEECFQLSRLQMQPEFQKRVSFVPGSVEDNLHLLDPAEVLIVDPPRKGLDPSLLQKILQSPQLEQLIYLSCGFESFKRDCAQLLDHGWKVDKAEAYLLFPGTNHLEILCSLGRQK
jgi:tRNA/tmRNA/rRNA uracil-C5-methylase (TrmA/RlmC/RlmD family)